MGRLLDGQPELAQILGPIFAHHGGRAAFSVVGTSLVSYRLLSHCYYKRPGGP